METPEYGTGKVTAGKRYYFIIHAYHHVIAEIVEMMGPQRAIVKDVHWIYSCERSWTKFFAEGAKKDTEYELFPPGEITWIAPFEWKHPLPSESKKGK